jgi:hypothetical protein
MQERRGPRIAKSGRVFPVSRPEIPEKFFSTARSVFQHEREAREEKKH